ncbi:hypothetical protein G210_0017, partial [Candida maltosa Xu316]
MVDSKKTSPRPEPTMIRRRNSSFANESSPWFRRNSFLSPSMIQNEDFQVYETNNYYNNYNTNSYSIISLKECQGFIFNQDLFATPYQQSRCLESQNQQQQQQEQQSPSKYKVRVIEIVIDEKENDIFPN